MDLLGEDVTNIEEVEIIKKGILGILKAIQVNKLRSGVSVKPTQLGLKLDKELAYQNIKAIIKEAAQSGIFVRIDMEDSSTTDDTLSLYRRLKAEGLRNTGVVIQACLRRSEADIHALAKENADFRLCKGIYDESPSIAFKNRQEIRDNYLKLLRIILENGSQVGIATHDDFLIDGAQMLLEEIHVPHEKYEFQMLLGVREKKRREIVRAGHRLRVYIPFGEQWYAYSRRRRRHRARASSAQDPGRAVSVRLHRPHPEDSSEGRRAPSRPPGSPSAWRRAARPWPWRPPRVYDARLLLAGAGLPRGGGVGFEIFDRGDLGVSEFTQKVNLRRATEGELARTISRLPGRGPQRAGATSPCRRRGSIETRTGPRPPRWW